MPRFEIPSDKYGRPLYNITPRATALERHVKALTDSFHIALDDDTTFIRVYAIAKDVYLKWADNGEDYVTSENFDEVIPAGQFIDMFVALQANGQLYDHIQVVGREAGATVVVIEK